MIPHLQESIDKYGKPYAITYTLQNGVPCRTVAFVHHTIDQTLLEMDRQTMIGPTTCRGSKPDQQNNDQPSASPM